MNEFSENAIRRFAERIDRDPGIVLGRLQNDQIVPFTNVALSKACLLYTSDAADEL